MDRSKIDFYRETIESAPLHKVLGLSIDSITGEISELSIPLNDYTLNLNGILHGGVLYLVADVAAYVALLPWLGENENAVTIDIECSIYNSGQTGPVRFKGHVASKKRRFAFINVEVFNGEHKLIGEARVTKALVRFT